jgi:hypothetical protein
MDAERAEALVHQLGAVLKDVAFVSATDDEDSETGDAVRAALAAYHQFLGEGSEENE